MNWWLFAALWSYTVCCFRLGMLWERVVYANPPQK
jgi:hypothetical protein